jgi:hypothetical protein
MCRSRGALEKAHKTLPKTLYETYDRILSNIHEDDRPDALRLLQWLAFALPPISLVEAVEVLATDLDADDGPLFDESCRLRNPQDILMICSSLVTISVPDVDVRDIVWEVKIDQERARFAKSGVLRLAHFSVQEYLISEHLRNSDATLSCYHFDKIIADTFIAKTCLVYLLHILYENIKHTSQLPMAFHYFRDGKDLVVKWYEHI